MKHSNILQSLDISPKFGVFKKLLNADDSFLTQALSPFFLTQFLPVTVAAGSTTEVVYYIKQRFC